MGLVQYESSDENEEVQTPVEAQHPQKQRVNPSSLSTDNAPVPTTAPAPSAAAESQPNSPPPPSTTSAPAPQPGPQLGPVLGPTRPPPPTTTPSQPEDPEDQQEEFDLSFLNPDNPEDATTNPPSPYTKTRTLLHNLTLPAHPNMDIPPSPPGTPPPGHDALTSKFTTFLQLKRTQGVHFNSRLAASAGMRNPSVGDKLMGFIGLETDFSASEDTVADAQGEDGEGISSNNKAVEQYSTVLSPDVWDGGVSFPPWAYKGPLRRAQEKGARERERGRGEAVEFVKAGGGTPGVGGGSAAGSRAGTPGLGSGAGKRKGRWDT